MTNNFLSCQAYQEEEQGKERRAYPFCFCALPFLSNLSVFGQSKLKPKPKGAAKKRPAAEARNISAKKYVHWQRLISRDPFYPIIFYVGQGDRRQEAGTHLQHCLLLFTALRTHTHNLSNKRGRILPQKRRILPQKRSFLLNR